MVLISFDFTTKGVFFVKGVSGREIAFGGWFVISLFYFVGHHFSFCKMNRAPMLTGTRICSHVDIIKIKGAQRKYSTLGDTLREPSIAQAPTAKCCSSSSIPSPEISDMNLINHIIFTSASSPV